MELSLLKQVVLIGIVVYVLLGLFLFVFQRSFIYFPSGESFDSCPHFSDEQRVVLDTARLFVSGDSSDYLVVYHGNAGSACDRAHLMQFSNRTLVLVEYPGYGGGDGRPSEMRFIQAVDEVVSWLDTQNPESVVVFGESIGSSSAAYHATISDVDRVVLVSPFKSLSKVASKHYWWLPTSLLLREEHPVGEYVTSTSSEVVVLHGEEDRVVPSQLSEDLGDIRVVIEGAGHNDLYASLQTQELLRKHLQ